VNAERLIAMVNDIANFFHAEPDRQIAIDGVAAHLRRFWAPRMREQLLAYVQTHGADGLSELAAAAVAQLAESAAHT
jgi:formate dehydrogenase subunit delta